MVILCGIVLGPMFVLGLGSPSRIGADCLSVVLPNVKCFTNTIFGIINSHSFDCDDFFLLLNGYLKIVSAFASAKRV